MPKFKDSGTKAERRRVSDAYFTMLDMIKEVMSEKNSVTFNTIFLEWFPDDKEIKKTIRKDFTDILGTDSRGNPKMANVIISLNGAEKKKCQEGQRTYQLPDPKSKKGYIYMYFCPRTQELNSLKDLHCDKMRPRVSSEMLILEMAWLAEIL